MNINGSSSIPEIHIKDFEKKPSDLAVVCLAKLFAEHSHLLTNPHKTTYYQLLIFRKGNGSLWIDSKKYDYKPGMVLALSKGNVECFECKENKTNGSSNILGDAILFTDEYLYKYPQDLVWINNLKLFDLSTKPHLLKLSKKEYAELEILIKKIRSELNSKDNFACEEIQINILKTLLLILERNKRERLGNLTVHNKNGSLHQEFKDKLEENYSHSRSVRFYADLLNVTPKKLNQATTNYLGGSSKKIIEERVLLEVKRLLIYTNQTAREIGFSMGFNDPTNFNKFFKRHTNITPAEFRATHKKDR